MSTYRRRQRSFIQRVDNSQEYSPQREHIRRPPVPPPVGCARGTGGLRRRGGESCKSDGSRSPASTVACRPLIDTVDKNSSHWTASRKCRHEGAMCGLDYGPTRMRYEGGIESPRADSCLGAILSSTSTGKMTCPCALYLLSYFLYLFYSAHHKQY